VRRQRHVERPAQCLPMSCFALGLGHLTYKASDLIDEREMRTVYPSYLRKRFSNWLTTLRCW